jgi:hypothetical protein
MEKTQEIQIKVKGQKEIISSKHKSTKGENEKSVKAKAFHQTNLS